MFTGLIEQTGKIGRIVPKGNYLEITIVPDKMFEGVQHGESIAVSGPCLTVTAYDATSFTVEASQETIRLTNLKGLASGHRVNLERALRADSRLGGHMVSGHIDCTLPIRSMTKVGQSLQIEIDLPDEFAPFIVDKGSVALDGVSLTVMEVGPNSFTVNLIPETQGRTTLHDRGIGDDINVEFDIVGKYILRFLDKDTKGKGITFASMRDMGF